MRVVSRSTVNYNTNDSAHWLTTGQTTGPAPVWQRRRHPQCVTWNPVNHYQNPTAYLFRVKLSQQSVLNRDYSTASRIPLA